ncbi:MAG: hypothetical protein M0R46_17555 [Candidatus Muirbacterium halophilum]|nr:hypothetical protein [Candidatus Muirbacterium halophilum]
MEFTALNGNRITEVESTEGGIVFKTEIEGIEANIEISGIVEIFHNGEMIELEEQLQEVTKSEITNTEIDVVNFDTDEFSQVIIEFENGDAFQLIGEMKGTVLNMSDFQHIIDERMSDEDEVCWDCGCEGCYGECECDGDEDCDCVDCSC